ncbi:type VII secretion protein EccB [Phytohabitans sp. LJ34]|uniref:type VII secretion protein EccB n=1 Tax=Phytohabitans sp. LJ34 TaxID=3452217 RepID=UPI003F8A70CA
MDARGLWGCALSSRQDQLHSHQFLLQRVVAALVLRDADPGRSPFPRAAGATVASVLLAAIAIGAVAVYGTVVDAATPRWGDGPAVLVERESGARLVFREGTLHPVPNHVSALLIVGHGVETVLVSQRSIDGLPRGVPLGIEHAPDAVPDPRRLATGAWSVCSTSDGAAVLVGAAAEGGAPLAERGLLVRAGGDLHLLWQQRRHLLRDRDLVLPALGWTAERPAAVTPGLLAALPEGPELARVPIPDAGEDAPAVPGAAVGDVFVVESQGGGRQYAVALAGGLAPITQLQADLLLTDLDQREPVKLAQGDFADLPHTALPSAAGLPPTTPPLVPPAATVCATVPSAAGASEVRAGGAVPRTGVVVPSGGAALVEAGGTIYLVTDRGRRHAMSDREALTLLGYADVRPVPLPERVVALIPEGVRLDPALARAPLGD